MFYSKAKIENDQLILTDTKQIDQSRLTSDCWLLQFDGLAACKDCEARNTPDCGGGETLKRLSA